MPTESSWRRTASPRADAKGLASVALLALLLVAPATSACRRQESIEEHRVRTAVESYNLLLPRVYATSRTELLEPVTGPDEQQRIDGLLTDLKARQWTLDCRQESFEITRIEIQDPPTMADLETIEVWRYRQVAGPGAPEAPGPKRIRYGLRYKLLQREGRWLVDRIEMLTSEDLPAAS